jgi:hypothetical protein
MLLQQDVTVAEHVLHEAVLTSSAVWHGLLADGGRAGSRKRPSGS